MEPHRAERVAEMLRTELDEILNYELDDPRLTAVAVTEVILAPGGRKASIRLWVDGSEEEAVRTLSIIENAKGHIRHVVAERLDIFRAPDLRFEADLSPRLRPRVEPLLRRLRKTRARAPDPAEKNPSQ
jgi:ribosome-binding factor A